MAVLEAKRQGAMRMCLQLKRPQRKPPVYDQARRNEQINLALRRWKMSSLLHITTQAHLRRGWINREKAVSAGDHGTQTKCAPTIKLAEAGNSLAGMLAQPNCNEVNRHVKVRIQHGECRQTPHTPQEALERTLCSWHISEDVVSTDNELGQPI